MRNALLLSCMMIIVSCSSPKYVYHFDHYDYNSGKKLQPQILSVTPEQEIHPFFLDEQLLVASSEARPVVLNEPTLDRKVEDKSTPSKKYRSMSREERREFRQALRREVKNYMEAGKNGDGITTEHATSAMDRDLKMAIIFGAVGLTLTLFGYVNYVFWVLGVVAIVIGVVFFVKWLVRQ